MRIFTQAEIEEAVARARSGLHKYQWLQARFPLTDVTLDAEFQRRFNGFYRVRRSSAWRAEYFEILQSSKGSGIDFSTALFEINRRTGRLEASFASKLVATLDPDRPVIDKYVLSNFGLKLPARTQLDRARSTVAVYELLRKAYASLAISPIGQNVIRCFDAVHPQSGISALKKVDLVLWQIR